MTAENIDSFSGAWASSTHPVTPPAGPSSTSISLPTPHPGNEGQELPKTTPSDPRRGWICVSDQFDGDDTATGEYFVDYATEYFDSFSLLKVFTDRASAVAYAIKAAQELRAKLSESVFGL